MSLRVRYRVGVGRLHLAIRFRQLLTTVSSVVRFRVVYPPPYYFPVYLRYQRVVSQNTGCECLRLHLGGPKEGTRCRSTFASKDTRKRASAVVLQNAHVVCTIPEKLPLIELHIICESPMCTMRLLGTASQVNSSQCLSMRSSPPLLRRSPSFMSDTPRSALPGDDRTLTVDTSNTYLTPDRSST